MTPEEVMAYVKEHQLEAHLSRVLNEAVEANSDTPLLHIADALDKIADEQEAKEARATKQPA